jgi:hypothetical protein
MSDRTTADEAHQPTRQQRLTIPRCRSAALASPQAVHPTTDARPPCHDRQNEDLVEEYERWDGLS